MTGFNHGITGAGIALTVKEPLLAVPLAFISHFLTDMIPHWDYEVDAKKDKFSSSKFNTVLATDFLLSVFLMIVLAIVFPGQMWLIWACMIAAASPDLMWAYYRLYIGHIKKRKVHLNSFAKLHSKIQSQPANGIYVEGAWCILMGALVFSFV